MMGLLLELFYLGVLALVVGCFAYLFVTRDRSQSEGGGWVREGEPAPPLSPDAASKAEALSRAYRLSS